MMPRLFKNLFPNRNALHDLDGFVSEQRDLLQLRLHFGIKYMAIPLVLGFLSVDSIFRPDLIYEFFFARLTVVPVAVFCFYLLPKGKLSESQANWFTAPGHLFCLYLGTLNAYLALRSGGSTSPYYAGINLVATGSLYFLPWSYRGAIVNTLCIYLPYMITLPLFSSVSDWSAFLTNFAFMTSTAFLGLTSAILQRQLRIQEFFSRAKLNDEILSKTAVIQKKTQEGVFLEKLASQFSPQVIDAIKTSDVSIQERTRREVTIIFIDVENSTARSGRIDYHDYINVLSQFFSECVDILLKYNVTVGTYLGDGLLSFVNAPQKVTEHRELGLMACLEILEHHERKSRYYLDQWRTAFNIRIGIHTGYTHVGFFPNFERGTYTTVGENVNLAARLCSKAKPNQICVTKDFVKFLNQDIPNMQVSKQEECDKIKGFEGERFELFSIQSNQHETIEESKCPVCREHPLEVTRDLGRALLLSCSGCGHKDVREKKIFQLYKTAAIISDQANQSRPTGTTGSTDPKKDAA